MDNNYSMINTVAFISILYCLGLGLSLLIYGDSESKYINIIRTVLIGLVYTVVASSILDVSKLTLITPLFNDSKINGLVYIYLISLCPFIYYLINNFKQKSMYTVSFVISLILGVLVLIGVFLVPIPQKASSSIIYRIKNIALTAQERLPSSISYICELFDYIGGSSCYNYNQETLSWLLSIVLVLLCFDLVIVNKNPSMLVRELILAGILLSLALTFHSITKHILLYWLIWSIFQIFSGNKQKYLLLKSMIVAIILNPLIWNILL
jgi:hypothetical protein